MDAIVAKSVEATVKESNLTNMAAQIAAFSGDPNFMTSLARGLAVISAFSKCRRRQTIADLARHTGLPRATVRRCLYTLVQLGYCESDGAGFQLCPRILTLGYSYLSSTQLSVLAQPIVDKVSRTVNESCSLAMLDGQDVVYVVRSNSRRVIAVSLSVGSHLPVYCTSLGRVLMAAQSVEVQKKYLAETRLLPLTHYTECNSAALYRIFSTVAEQGFSVVDQELELGLRSIAVPVRNMVGDVVAALNTSVPVARMSDEEMLEKLLPELQHAAEVLSATL